MPFLTVPALASEAAPRPLPTPSGGIEFSHGYEGEEARKVEEALGILLPSCEDILRAFRLELDERRRVELGPHEWCRHIDRYQERRPAFLIRAGDSRVNLCRSFFRKDAEARAATLGHELVHVLGLRDEAQGVTHQYGSRRLTEAVRTIIRRTRRTRSRLPAR